MDFHYFIVSSLTWQIFLFNPGAKEENISMILIGSATASSVFLIALLLWAFLLTAERFSESDTFCLMFLLLFSNLTANCASYELVATSRADSRLLSWSWATVVCSRSPVRNFDEQQKPSETPSQEEFLSRFSANSTYWIITPSTRP